MRRQPSPLRDKLEVAFDVEQLDALKALSERTGVSKAEHVRQALAAYLTQQRTAMPADIKAVRR